MRMSAVPAPTRVELSGVVPVLDEVRGLPTVYPEPTGVLEPLGQA